MSLTFRLFDDPKLRSCAIGLIVSVAMIGFAVGPIVSGLAVAHLPWQVLLVVNAPVAAIAWFGVRRGIAADDPAELRRGATDVPGALLSVAALGLMLYTFTVGAEHGWLSAPTFICAIAALLAGAAFVARERAAADPMLDLSLFRVPTFRGAAIMQTSVTVAMVGAIFASTQIFQFVWGRSPMQAGFANLPTVAGMFLAGSIIDRVIERFGHRQAAIIGAVVLIASLVAITVSLGHGYIPFAIGTFVLTIGVRLVMTTCAVELIDSLPRDHTSIGAAMNDTAQEVGNAVGVGIVGTVSAMVVGATLPGGVWPQGTADAFMHGLHISFALLAVVVTVIAWIGARSLSDSKALED